MTEFGLVLGFDAFGAVEQCIAAIKLAGLQPVAVLNRTGANYPCLPFHNMLRSPHVNRNHEELVKSVKARLSFLSGGDDYSVRVILNFQDRMWLAYRDLKSAFPSACGLDWAMIESTSVKANMRFRLRSTRLAAQYWLVSTSPNREDGAFERELTTRFDGKALVVKPILGMGGEGVSVLRKNSNDWNFREIRKALKKADRAQRRVYGRDLRIMLFDLKMEVPVIDYVIIEEFLEGTEYSLEGYVTSGHQIRHFLEQEKTRTEFGVCVRDHEYAVSLDQNNLQRSTQFAFDLARHLGFRGSAFHLEAVDCKERLVPIEFNPRPGGGTIVDLVRFKHGVDLRQVALQEALSGVRKNCYAVVSVIQPHREGMFEGCKGLAKAARAIDCVFARELVAPGSKVRLDMEFYLAEICVVGKTIEAASVRARELASCIRPLITQS